MTAHGIRRSRPLPLTPEQVAELRASVPCHGCGAVRRQHGERTRITHRKWCPVRHLRESS